MKFEATPQVTPKKAVHFDSTHNDWCTVPNFMTMYEEMYEAMVQSGVAIKQNKEVVVDRDGKVVQRSEDLAFEEKKRIYCCILIWYCSLMKLVIICHTKMMGMLAVKNFWCKSSYINSQFSVLGFMTASGKPVCCVIILLSSEVETKHVMRLQP